MINQIYMVEIAGIRVGLHISKELEIEDAFQCFMEEGEPDLKVTFVPVEQLSEIKGQNLVTEDDAGFFEYEEKDQYVRLYHRFHGYIKYAVLRKKGPREWICEYLNDYSSRFTSLQTCFEHIAFERILLDNQAMILHASLIKTCINQKAVGILFTGVSGIGKSTQAALWETNEGATVLNGDRTILRKKEGSWYGYGSPYAGSSNIYRNEGVPICAVVVLEQADTNECMRLRVQEAFKRIYAGLTVNTWNPDFVRQVFEWNTDLCMNVPVYTLKCRPEKEAVEVLKQKLEQL